MQQEIKCKHNVDAVFQLSDKEEALAHQRKVSYMLAQSYEDLEKRLQAQLKDLDTSHTEEELTAELDRSNPTEDPKADHRSCSCDNTAVVINEYKEKTVMAGLQNEAGGK